jgi:hypothetical protein
MMVAGLVESPATSWSIARQAVSARSRCKEERMLVFRLVRIMTVALMAALGLAHAASAANFDGVGQHTLTSSNLSFTSAGLGGGVSCTQSVFEVNVAAGGATATVTGATFDGCNGLDALSPFVADVSASGFPWTITRTATGAFTIDGVRVTANVTGAFPVDFFGSLPGTINNGTHVVTFAGSGLTATATTTPDQTAPATVSGTFTDDQGSLAVT